MPKIEIDETEYAELKRVADVARLIGAHPKARERLHEAVAMAAPDQAGPEIRIRQEVTERFAGIEDKLDKFLDGQTKAAEAAIAKEAERDLQRRWTEGRTKARAANYTDEGLGKLEEFMEKEGIANHEHAMVLFERANPPAEPVVTGGSRWNFFDAPKDDVTLAPLMQGDDEAFLRQAIPAALKDVRGGR